ncbi:MAG: hypothetical protein GXP49_06330 [Deltaproteobacteria bacterium]|nr:hypothetical protein [Deltaproteobacteria bacterium]
MKKDIEVLAGLLVRIMDEGIQDDTDFFDLAATGELIRRITALETDQVPDEAIEAIRKYEQALDKGFDIEVGTSPILQASLDRLEKFSKRDIMERRGEEYEDLLDAVEDSLAYTVAAYKAGVIEAPEVRRSGQQAYQRIYALAHRVPELWDYAEERYLGAADDPDFPGLYAFFEPLRLYSSFNLALEDSFYLMSGSKRKELIEKALDNVSKKKTSPRETVVEKLREKFSRLEQLIPVNTVRLDPVALFKGDKKEPPRMKILRDFTSLQLIQDEKGLCLTVERGHSLEVKHASLDKVILSPKRVSNHTTRLKSGIGPFSGRLELAVLIDGETIELPGFLLQPGNNGVDRG